MDDATPSVRATEAERVVLEWLDARERGVAADPEELLRLHPDLADALRERFQAIDLVDAALAVPDAAPPPQRIGRYREHPDLDGEPTAHFAAQAAFDQVVVPAGAEGASPRSIGEFQIVREIGRGGMGVVYEAEQSSMRRLVALKVLFPAVTSNRKAVLRFQREARAAGRLHHTNIVPVYGMGEERGVWWYAMELVHGRPLDAVIEDVRRVRGEQRARKKGTPKSSAFGTDPGTREHYERVAGAFAGVAEGLDLAHQAGVVHRDVKPSNLILDAEGRLMLTDFGLARVEDEGATMTLSGDVLGTPAYMSPEQVRAEPEGIDARTDVYSLGATLYEVLTLRAPFHGAAPAEIFSKITSKDPVPPRRVDSRIPRDLATIVEKAMEKERARRYATAGDMAHDLRLYAEGAAIRARRIGPLGRAWRTARRHKALTSLAAAVVLLAVGGAVAAIQALRAQAKRDELQYANLCMAAEDELARGIQTGFGSWIRIEGEQATRAHALLDQAIELDRDRPEAYFGRALAGDAPMGARFADLDTALAHGLGEATYHLSRAVLLRVTGRVQESEAEEQAAESLHEIATSEDFYFRGRLRMSRGERRDAIEKFTEALRLAPADGFVRHMALFARALALETENKLLDAIEDLAALDGSGAARPGVRVRMASLWRRAGHPEQAEAMFTKTLEEACERPSLATFRELSSVCGACREIQWAERASEATAKSFENNCDVLIERSAALGAAKRSEEGLKAAERAVALEPGNARAYVEQGRRLLELAKLPDAIVAFGRALALSPGMVDACSGCAEAHLRLGKREEAIAAWRKAVDAAPDKPYVHNAFGAFLCDQARDYDGAEAAFRKAIDLAPDEDRFHSNLAKALIAGGKRGEAAAAFRDAAAKLRDAVRRKANPQTHYRLGLMLVHLHDVDENASLDDALAEFRRALELDPHHVDARYEAGTVLLDKGKLDDAIAEFNEVLRIDPGVADAHFNLGIAFEGKKDLAQAANHYREAARLAPTNPNTPNALNSLGCCLLSTDDVNGAEAAFRAAVEIDPSAAWPTFNLGSALYRKYEFFEALHWFRSGVELAKKQGIKRDDVGDYLNDKRECERIVALKPVLDGIVGGAAPPTGGRELDDLGKVCHGLRRYAKGAEFHAKALAADPEGGYRYDAACDSALAGCGRGDDAPPDGAHLRAQALAWLDAELAACRRQVESGDADARGKARSTLEHMQRDGDFAGIRDDAELAKLPEPEGVACRKFWAKVADLLASSRAGPAAPPAHALPEACASGDYSDWGPPVNLDAPINAAGDEYDPALSEDGLSLYFASDRPGGRGVLDLWVARRESEDASWGAPVNLGPTVNSEFIDRSPAFSPDGRSLYFSSTRPGGHGNFDLYVATRTHTHDDFDWGTAVNLGDTVNSNYPDLVPRIFVDEERGRTELYLAVLDKPGGRGGFDFYLSLLGADGRFGPPVNVVELNSPSLDWHAAIRHDGREMIITSERPGGSGKSDLWVSTRATTSDPWTTPVNLGGTVNSPSFDGGPALSWDGKTLIFHSTRRGGHGGCDLWMTTRRHPAKSK